MMQRDGLDLLRKAVEEADDKRLLAKSRPGGGQSKVAKRLGYSSTAISQALNGKYAGNLDNLLNKVVEIYGNRQVVCPILGTIPLAHCAEERRKPFSASNPIRVRLFTACKRCINRR